MSSHSPPWFVVTGCARSGTMYASELFSAAGIPCGHETVFTESPLDPEGWQMPAGQRGDSSWLAAPFVDRLETDTLVLHQVRNPLAVLRSHLGFGFFAHDPDAPQPLSSYREFIDRWCPPVFKTSDEILRCLRYWELWNRLVEEGARRAGLRYRRYRVEEVDLELLRELTAFLGSNQTDSALEQALASVDRATNTWGATDASLAWEALPDAPERAAARRLAVEYGYS